MNTLLVMARRIVKAAWRYRWAAVALAWVICGAGWAFVYTIPNQYEASRAALCRCRRDPDAAAARHRRRQLAGQPARRAAAHAAEPAQPREAGLQHRPRPVDHRARRPRGDGQRARHRIKITPQTRNLFTITYRNTNPKLAFDVVQTILTTFIESKTGNNRSEMENAGLFLQQQIGAYERQLRDAEKKRAEFRAKYLDLLPMGEAGATGLDAARGTCGTCRAARRRTGQARHAEPRTGVDPGHGGDRHQRRRRRRCPGQPGRDRAQSAGGGSPARAGRTADHADREPSRRDAGAQAPGRGQGLGRQGSRRDWRRQTAAASRGRPARPRPLPAKAAGGEDRRPRASRHRDSRRAALEARAERQQTATPKPAAANSRSVPNPVYEQLKVRMFETESALSSLQRQIADATHERDRLDEMARSAPGIQAEYINLNRDYDVLQTNYKELLGRREEMRSARPPTPTPTRSRSR